MKLKNKTLWLILAWIFLLPFTATYFVIKSNKLDKTKKIVIITILWILFIVIGIMSDSYDKKELKSKILECYSKEIYDKLDELIGIENIGIDNSDEITCDNLKLINNNRKEIKIKLSKNKEIIYIKVGNDYKYGTDTIKKKNKSKSSSSKLENYKSEDIEKENKQPTKKEDYEFETIKGFTTLQSLIMNINDNTKFSKVKDMANYVGYYIKDNSYGEHYGIIKIIYNTDESKYYNESTEHVMLIYDDYKGKELSKIEYSVSIPSITYTYYVSDKTRNNVYSSEGKKYIDNFKDAFTYINKTVGYEG